MDAGSGGLSVAHQISDRFKKAGQPLNKDDIAIVDAAEYHYYQVSPHHPPAQ
jgi:eukaryotic sulfide quinone oxidoreductase